MIRELEVGDAVEVLHTALADARDELARVETRIEELQTERRYWQGRKDGIMEVIGTIEKGRASGERPTN
jgi:hypothetical protein